ncbi:S8 family serine peptidase [Winogradskyella sp.]|jgi:hypothetical protein|uniref:S8 family serine peptidase n=1 Tax=Winogradskyella sp. TaxID=1883156 RepID=UPI0025EF7AAA|nr:S8 family serine peptidase [Winogradskyella sp.]MCT4628477.1 S8 family serine peptidase [Winogradskyella sp.]
MKRLLFVLSLLLINITASAQVIEISKEKFETLPKEQKELYLRIKTSDSINSINIDKYLKDNGLDKAVIRENNKTFVLTDLFNGYPIYTTTDNEDAAIATRTNHLQVGGSLGLNLDGSGITVRVWDGGPIQSNHVEFQNQSNTQSRVQNAEGLNTEGNPVQDQHATHVTGTISAKGVNSSAKGMATAVDVRTFNFNNDTAEMIIELNNTFQPMIISNHSYGVPIDQPNGGQIDPWRIGAYTADARELDDLLSNNHHYLVVASAGNSGNTAYPGGMAFGFDKLTGDKNAKNNLVIANASPTLNPFTNQIDFSINSGSSQGPTDDLRIKPDIAGDGTALFSPVPGDAYGTLTGTSMSAPNVTGSLVLLQQYYNQLHGQYMMASTLKGLACHTATDDTDNIGPDPYFGWGLLNSEFAAETITDANSGVAIIEELTLNNGNTYSRTFSAQAGDKLSATICWTDVPGVSVNNASEINNQTPRLVNDLDVRITKDGVTYLPWKLNFSGTVFSSSKGDNIVDNIERIDIDVPTSGNYTLEVSHKGSIVPITPFQPQSQDFSLIITGDNLTLSIDENDLLRKLAVYPNPSKGEFTISFESNLRSNDSNVNVDVYDLQGRLVYNNSFINASSIFKETIALNNAKAGVYMVNISEGNRTTSHKLIIE